MGDNWKKIKENFQNEPAISKVLYFLTLVVFGFDYSCRTLRITVPNRYWNPKHGLLGVNSYIYPGRNSV